MTWRGLVCALLGHRPRVVDRSFYAICQCCDEVIRIDNGKTTHRPTR